MRLWGGVDRSMNYAACNRCEVGQTFVFFSSPSSRCIAHPPSGVDALSVMMRPSSSLRSRFPSFLHQFSWLVIRYIHSDSVSEPIQIATKGRCGWSLYSFGTGTASGQFTRSARATTAASTTSTWRTSGFLQRQLRLASILDHHEQLVLRTTSGQHWLG